MIYQINLTMCIIIAGEDQPESTKLINIPVKIEGEDNKYNFFIYVNDFNMDKTKNAVMVVPFPVEKNTTISPSQIGLVDMTTPQMKTLISGVEKLFYEAALGMSRGFNEVLSLKVHKVGNYNISVALSIDDLLNRIDWNTFTKPDNFNQRMGTFNNEKLYPTNYNYFYIVAETTENIKNDGFGVVYPQLNDVQYIPTAHEDNEYTNIHQFDVEIYNFNYRKLKPQDCAYNNINVLEGPYMFKNDSFKHVLGNVNGQSVKMLDETSKQMHYDENIKSVGYKVKQYKMVNHNVWLPK